MRKRLKNSKLGKVITDKFDDELHFIKTWAGNPKATGSIVPTGPKLARSMVENIRVGSGLPVLELGPGTGAITQAILDFGVKAEDLYALEYSPEFLQKLEMSFPDVNFIHGDAFDLDAVLEKAGVEQFDTVISALPLLNFPQEDRVKLIEALLDRLPPGRPVVQFSYGAHSPVAAKKGSFSAIHHDWVMRNVPPARVWLYQR